MAVSVSLPAPSGGFNVSQSASSLTDQALFDVTVNVVLPAEYSTFWFGGSIVSIVVLSIVPTSPTAVPFFESVNETPKSQLLVPLT